MKDIFEALMRSKGHTDFSLTKTGKYNNLALRLRWSYFQLGWEMAKVNK